MTSRLAQASPTPARLPCVLLTGFDAFAGASLNPSWLAVQALQGEVVAGHVLLAAQLPTAFAASLQRLRRLMRQHKPGLVVGVGQAGGRAALSLERIAINIDDARIADNAGAQPLDMPVIASGPAAYFSTLPIKAMLHGLQSANIAAEVSQTAGTFVCNHVFYGLMHTLSGQREKTVRGGFIHVPFLTGQGEPCMALEEMVRGLRLAVEIALTTPSDMALGAGSLN